MTSRGALREGPDELRDLARRARIIGWMVDATERARIFAYAKELDVRAGKLEQPLLQRTTSFHADANRRRPKFRV